MFLTLSSFSDEYISVIFMTSRKDSFIPFKLVHRKKNFHKETIYCSYLNLLQAFIANLNKLEGIALNNTFFVLTNT